MRIPTVDKSTLPDWKVEQYIVTLNLHRRHLTNDQKEVILEKLTAGQRAILGDNDSMNSTHGGDRKSNQTANLLLDLKPLTQKAASKKFKTSERNIRNARKLRIEAPDLHQQVNTGQTSLNDAMTQLKRRQNLKQGAKDSWSKNFLYETAERIEFEEKFGRALGNRIYNQVEYLKGMSIDLERFARYCNGLLDQYDPINGMRKKVMVKSTELLEQLKR
jgi:hypothetical protein